MAHVELTQIPVVVQIPELQVADRVPVYPELHCGVQDTPLGVGTPQSPMMD